MEVRYKVSVRTRSKPMPNGRFQTDIVPNEVLDVKEIAKRWARQSMLNPSLAESLIGSLEGYILEEVGKGNQLNFGLATFEPRLSGSLPMRDSSPADEGLCVRGAVKARRKLLDGPKSSLEAVNVLPSVRTSLTGVIYEGSERREPIRAGVEIVVMGDSIPVVAGREDEGVWLESKRQGKVAKGRIVESQEKAMRVVFDELPQSGKYFLVVATRCGRDATLKPVRCRAEVSVRRE